MNKYIELYSNAVKTLLSKVFIIIMIIILNKIINTKIEKTIK